MELLEDTDGTAAHRLKKSKWIKGSYDAMSDGFFWLLIRISSIATGPLAHAERWLESQVGKGRTLVLVLL